MRSPADASWLSQLANSAEKLDTSGDWPREQLFSLGQAGVYNRFVPTHLGGEEWSEIDLLSLYEQIAQACLTTAFILTQRQGAMGRIMAGENSAPRERWLSSLMTGESFATVAISHLTTSRRHLTTPVLQAEQTSAGFVLHGYSPWVTGAAFADVIVVGATLQAASMAEAAQVLLAVPTNLPGVRISPGEKLVALSSSHTGRVDFDAVVVPQECLLAGPVPEVMKQNLGARTGGLPTSALALGLTAAALEFLSHEQQRRSELLAPVEHLREEHNTLRQSLHAFALNGGSCHESVPSAEQIRTQANSLVLRATQAALVAAKGAGFAAHHPAGRWCREALFFLVWSCPQAVAAANLCELAGLAD